ncbi:SO_0444 family Cu/Zn efflux transporter [Thalassotalea euphylliae]|uniref:Permease n=1 Tax=Thalassotalea euphylliae TaxID=1655234 RepID=A0A3E0UFT1_9GAMM|nr:SO_0444 family Cu/Zn efflux transporter [Thalassotalea euphylliae]REL34622.1 permease [Thalassotalea euphylliae]
METASLLVSNFIALTLDASPWLLLGLLIAGLMKAWLPSQLLSKHLGQGNRAIVKAALVGAPLPLCSCGVIPVATELKRSGASSPATSSFLVATPETGVDSITVSYAMLGPFFAVFRPVSAIVSAIATGFLVKTAKPVSEPHSNSTQAKASCCSSKTQVEEVHATETATSCCSSTHDKATEKSAGQKTLQGVNYALTQLIDDIIKWLLVGLIFATLVKTFIPTELLTAYGSGIPAMLLMILISIPMYICATASTPIAAGFIMAGISPGTALVFMMAGPATNISTLGVIKNEMGSSVLSRYLLGISVSAIAFGLLLDELVTYLGIDVNQQMQHSHELLPFWLSAGCALLLFVSAIKPLRRKIID